ncbi:MAG TPA: IS1182 family transposase [Actinomycetota bacterium]|jgi:IS5 family transposase|nr:IS1182 family transposase [Actinomycetota bacterium]
MQGHSEPNRELLDAAALCRQLVPEGSVGAFLADHRLELFPDEMFSDLFPSGRGRPSVPADVIASVMVLQALEGLSDRDAARALKDRISWKVACGLALDDPGFHHTVLTYWRNRLQASERPERIFDVVREVIRATGVLKGKTRRALDSTLLDDAVATQDTVTQLTSQIRRVRREVPGAASVEVHAHDYDAGAKPVIAWDDPVAKAQLVSALVNDALAVLGATEGTELTEGQRDAVGLLALVAGQDVEPGEDEGTWRITERVAPDRVISTVDPEARHMHKSRSHYRDGYKAHLAVEPETGLVTAAALTPGNAGDGPTGVAMLAKEERGLEVLADSAYGSGEVRAALARKRHRTFIKPIPLRSAVPGGFTIDDFAIDTAAGTVTCPQGHTVRITPRAKAVFGWRCTGCPVRERCTRSRSGRTIQVHPHHDAMAAARRHAETEEFQRTYRRHRPMAERSIAWLVARGHRRVRYRGVVRNQMWLSVRAAAIDLRRLINLGLDHSGGWILAT